MLKCQLCDYEAKQLHQHIKSAHKISSAEYRAIYGNVKMQLNFNQQVDDVDKHHSSYVKKGYNKIQKRLKSYGTYELEVTRMKLKSCWENYIGKSKYRTLINDDPKLYNSIIHYSKDLPIKTTLEDKMKFILFFDCNIEKSKCYCKRRITFGKNCRYCSSYYYKHQNLTGFLPSYNKESIPIIESVAKSYNIYDVMHAENGGEFTTCGFYLDGYSPSKNIAFEYDEKYHFTKGELKSSDKERMSQIQGVLGCKFIRISETGEINEY